MTSLLPPATSSAGRTRQPAAAVGHDLATRRPLVLVASIGGVAAAAATLLVCLGAGVVGWFLTDGGSHGAPRDGLRAGALGWLLGHGSGITVEGALITAVPLGVTLLCAWSVWRLGQRVGTSVSGHGPDADAIVDGQRDFTVPLAAALFTAGYVVTAVVTASAAATATTPIDTGRVVTWSFLLCAVVGAPAIAVGSGRAAIWASFLPDAVRAGALVARRVTVLWAAVSLLTVLIALVVDFSTAANVMSQLGADTGASVLIVGLSLLVLPNAALFAGAYLLGPGFTVGTATLVTPGAVVLGPLPMLPLLAALPDDGATPGWTAWLVVVPAVVAFVAGVLAMRARPTPRYLDAALHGCVGGVVAGLGFGLLAGLAGGSIGPGRMQDVAPFAFDAMLHAVPSFGIGALLGALTITWWQRRDLLDH